MKSRTPRTVIIYSRLSQEDLRNVDQEPIEEKFRKRIKICEGLAAQHDLDVEPSNIFTELETGTSLAQRPVLLDILQRCKRGEVSHLITPAQDRLMRGDRRDLQDVEDALCSGRVTLLSTEGVIDFGDPNYDTTHKLLVTVKAAVDEQYVLSITKKRRETNTIRFREGHRSGGSAPYGYKWVKAVYERRQLVVAPHYEIMEDEYPTVCEIFRRLRTEGLFSIATDLSNRLRDTGTPLPPGYGRRSDAQPFWSVDILWKLVRNPHYAGYPVQRSTIIRKKRIRLEREDWIMPAEEGDYPHPITLAEYEELQELMTARAQRSYDGKPAVRPARAKLLTGLLVCPQGKYMTGMGRSYECACRQHGNQHLIASVSCERTESAVVRAVAFALAELPPDYFRTVAPKTDHAAVRTELNSVTRQLRELEDNAHDLITYARRHISNFGEEGYNAACQRNRRAIEQAQSRQKALRTELDTPDLSALAPVLQQIRKHSFAVVWDAMTTAEQRELLQLLISSVVPAIPGGKRTQVRDITVTFAEWMHPFLPPTRKEPLLLDPVRAERKYKDE